MISDHTSAEVILFYILYGVTGAVPVIAALYLLFRRANAIAPDVTPPLAYYSLHLVCLTLSVLLLCTLTFFYARKNWKSYTKRNLWAICVIDMLIATLYNLDIYLEPTNEYTNYMLTEIWIRPTITYGLVACFVTEVEKK